MNSALETYLCHGSDKMYPDSWHGSISKKILHGNIIELDVEARCSYFHIIIGQSDKCTFLCVPNWGIGTEIAGFDNRHWNLEHIKKLYPKIHEVDIISIVDCIAALNEENA